MASVIEVVSEDMWASAERTQLHAVDLQLRHGAADSRIAAAQTGVPAGAAVALGAAVTRWQTTTAVLSATLAQHGIRFGVCEALADSADRDSGALLDAVGQVMSLGLRV